MKVTINGQTNNIDARTIDEIVKMKELDASGLVIEHNGEIIKQKDWPKQKVAEGDKLELLSFVGGG